MKEKNRHRENSNKMMCMKKMKILETQVYPEHISMLSEKDTQKAKEYKFGQIQA